MMSTLHYREGREYTITDAYALAAERLCRAVEVAALLTIFEGLFGGSDMGALNAADKARRLYNDAARAAAAIIESTRAPEARKEES
jgi:surfactin synthase thioesterase subunit